MCQALHCARRETLAAEAACEGIRASAWARAMAHDRRPPSLGVMVGISWGGEGGAWATAPDSGPVLQQRRARVADLPAAATVSSMAELPMWIVVASWRPRPENMNDPRSVIVLDAGEMWVMTPSGSFDVLLKSLPAGSPRNKTWQRLTKAPVPHMYTCLRRRVGLTTLSRPAMTS